MRKAFRIIYTILMPILFLAVLAVFVSFNMTVVMNMNATYADDILTGNANTTFNIEGAFFTVKDWTAGISKTLKLTIGLNGTTPTVSLEPTGDAVISANSPSITIGILSAIGFLVFAVGCFMSEVGYGSKVVTIMGTILLIGGSVLFFIDNNFQDGLRYIINVEDYAQDGTPTVTNVINVNVEALKAQWIALGTDALSLMNMIIVVVHKKEA